MSDLRKWVVFLLPDSPLFYVVLNLNKAGSCLDKLYDKIKLFGFIVGYGNNVEYKGQDYINIKAAELMRSLHNKLKAVGYDGHALEVYLVWLLFCMFADDTAIFNKKRSAICIRQRSVFV